jgi:hypothetical protein
MAQSIAYAGIAAIFKRKADEYTGGIDRIANVCNTLIKNSLAIYQIRNAEFVGN